jgi:hypothetical protein
VGQILPLVLRDRPQPGVHLAQSDALGGNEVEQVSVDETIKVGRELHRCLFSQAGKTIDMSTAVGIQATGAE